VTQPIAHALIAALVVAFSACGGDDDPARSDAGNEQDGAIGTDAATDGPSALDGNTGPDATNPDGGPAPIDLGLAGRSFTFDGVETFMLSISYYGGCAAPEATVVSDLARLASLGFNNVRVWAAWPTPSLAASVLRSDGSLDADALARLELLLDTARAHGMTVDVTFAYGIPGASDGGFDSYRTGIDGVAAALLGHRNVFFDLGNERDVGDERYLSAEQVRDLAAAVRARDPSRLVTASLGGNAPSDAATKYIELYSVADIDFATPHFPRDDVWAAETQARVETMRGLVVDAGWDRAIYLQEDARRGYGSATWPKEDFLTAATGAHAASAAGWCFHNDAGFDLGTQTLFDQLDDVELDTIDELASAVGL